jgi:predicted O-methyltransferase YrrM
MMEQINQSLPPFYAEINQATQTAGFTMASDVLTCSLLRTLAASKPAGRFLELGTGTGLSTAWILDGMDGASSLVSIDNAKEFLAIARNFLHGDKRLQLVETDGEEWITNNKAQKFDYIFADTWHGKYFLLDEVLSMPNKGGLYIIDDMLHQPNWPEGHDEKVSKLIDDLEKRKDLVLTKQNWATGIIVATKR